MIRKEKLKKVIDSQREWIKGIEEGTKREILEEINLSKSKALVISGIRRCGKSTLLKQILNKQENFFYLNLEDPRLEGFELNDFNKAKEIFEKDFSLGSKEEVYFFDEIQNVQKWESFIRFLVDRNKKVVITGSNASLLSKELGSKLTGRHKKIEMFPFSYKEFLRFSNLKPSEDSYNKFLSKGGFPEYLKENDVTDLNELLRDIVMRDIAVRYGIKNTSILEKMAVYLLSNPGKEFSYNSIKKMFSIKSVQSVVDYISYFVDSYLLFTAPLFSYSYKKQQINPKKTYSIDNGFSFANTVSFSEDRGKMLENSVYLELRRNQKNIFYFQENGECDFLIKEKNKITKALQVCYEITDENQEREINGILEALRKFKLDKGHILTYNQEDEFEKNNKKIIVKPVWKWLSEEEIN